MTSVSRRAFLRGSAAAVSVATVSPAALAAAGLTAPAFAQQTTDAGEDWVRVYLVVIDGLRPDEVVQMPTLNQLATDGWYYPNSRAQMIAETTPNHVSMITGMRVDRHGMPGNDVAYVDDNIGVTPRYLQTDTLYSLIARQAPDMVATAATSKEYIVQMTKHMRVDRGTEDADATNDPFIVPVSGHAIDAEVGPDALAQSTDLDPDFGWMSLGDVDRVGHTDLSGATGLPPVARTLSLQTADLHVGRLVSALQDAGRWDNTVMIVTADHSMDWSTPDSIVSLSATFDEDADLAGRYDVAQNGGAGIYWLRSPDADGADERLKAMRNIAMATDGVTEAWYTRPNPADGGTDFWVGVTRPDWGLTGDRTGDLVVFVADGYRLTEPAQASNPIPGNHGHVATLPIPQIIAGGWDGLNANDDVPGGEAEDVADDVRLEGQGENIDIAPTVAWLLNLNPPPGGYDGRVLSEAFARRPDPRVPVVDVPNVPRYREAAGDSRQATSVALSMMAFPEATDADGNPVVSTVVLASGDTFPDALAATPLAVASGGPLLLTPSQALDSAVAAEIQRLSPTTVYLVGGETALSPAVESAVAGLGVETVTRLAGDSRYGTAAAIAAELVGGAAGPALPGFGQDAGGAGPDVILASGENFPDALAAGPLAAVGGRVILLTRPDELPEATAAALASLAPSRVIVAGGPAAVSDAVLEALAADADVERLGGDGRFDTAALLMERTIREGGLTDLAFVVSGDGFADALAAGATVGLMGGMLVPLSPAGLRSSGGAGEVLLERADGLVEVVWVGGTAALPTDLRDQVEARILLTRSRT
ncbi:hypothetical protein DVS28_a1467 [Euzebya pacifica]|uniref:Type I phosphodiesterase / nucleotide pyrophosphatase n=1 Tax=Euzebya pacifica TaxID=1608957 RepID=A0A346XVB8_9ACTN|nr:cell wall-binding repeat-containing protein [Euzebya pacifica]AXV06165.1 hypothetical protein DVS28_a1467 [Euzebya pacifica]